jgi:peptidoglycan/xylan/chitin deacetylase (PgdA/CDA1 family)
LSFDDTVTEDVYDQMSDILTDHWNPNGDPIQVTFFVWTGGSDYWSIGKLAAEGNEMAVHTMTHTTDATTDLHAWRAEIVGCRKTLSDLAGIPREEIVGFRAPSLKYSYRSLHILLEQGMGYDSSVVEWPGGMSVGPDLMTWPYTLDYGVPVDNLPSPFRHSRNRPARCAPKATRTRACITVNGRSAPANLVRMSIPRRTPSSRVRRRYRAAA